MLKTISGKKDCHCNKIPIIVLFYFPPLALRSAKHWASNLETEPPETISAMPLRFCRPKH
jgi:hypothetical protein